MARTEKTPLVSKGKQSQRKRSLLSRWYYRQGLMVSRHPWITALVCLVFIGVTCVGLLDIVVESNPEKIWVPPSSTTQLQQKYFNFMFTPFYRIEEVYFTVPKESGVNMVTRPYLLAMLDLQEAIVNATDSRGHKLDDFCYKPIRGKGCIIESPLNYFRSNRTALEHADYRDIQLATACVAKLGSGQIPCMSEIGVPVMESVVLGGITCNASAKNPDPCRGCIPEASALVLTFLLDNTRELADDAAVWEKEVFLRLAREHQAKLKNAGPERIPVDVSFMAQRSIQDQLALEDKQNAFVVVVSYIAMFLYISVALGKFPHPVRSRSLLGLLGIFLVISSVGSALGMCSFFGTKITMIVTEVVPFLILAIGVDNMFILSKAYDREALKEPTASVEELMARALAEVGPSITAAASSEVLAFGVGATTHIPALESFCLVAAVAVLVDFLLQVTWFVAAISMDARRMRENRADMGVCVTVKPNTATKGKFWKSVNRGHYVHRFIDTYYARFLMNPIVKTVVILLWLVFLIGSCYGATKLRLGLDEHYLIPYFNDEETLGEAGPPLYFVLQNVDYENNKTADALNAMVEGLSTLSDWIDTPIYSWVSEFSVWTKARDVINGKLCDNDYCDCKHVPAPDEMSLPERLAIYLNISIDSTCCQHAGYCGAQFSSDVRLVEVNGTLQILSSRLRSQHTALRNQKEYIQAMMHTQKAVELLNTHIPQTAPVVYPGAPEEAPGGAVFPYSLFYVYYEQYSYIQGVAIQNVLAAMSAVFFATLIVSNLSTALLVSVCVACIVVDLVGWVWVLNPHSGTVEEGDYGVQINAVSVVNLIMAVGLAVEFCVHVIKAFTVQRGTRNERAQAALVEMGSSVVTGITCTKYYFRMYLGIIVLGAFHGLMFAPVVLSLIGPPPSKLAEDKHDNVGMPMKPHGGSDDAGAGAGVGVGVHAGTSDRYNPPATSTTYG